MVIHDKQHNDVAIFFTVFGGSEFLKPNVLNSLQWTKNIGVIWQSFGLDGKKHMVDIERLVGDLKSEGLLRWEEKIDPTRLQKLQYKMLNASKVHKRFMMQRRQRGISIARAAEIKYIMLIDVDEFHCAEDIHRKIEEFKTYDFIVSRFKHMGNFGTTEKVVNPMCQCPVFQRTSYDLNRRAKAFNVDPARRVMCPPEQMKIYEPEEFITYHYSWFRYSEASLLQKVNNSSWQKNHRMKGKLQDTIDDLHTSNQDPSKYYDIGDVFGIEAYWNGEFQKYLMIDQS